MVNPFYSTNPVFSSSSLCASFFVWYLHIHFFSHKKLPNFLSPVMLVSLKVPGGFQEVQAPNRHMKVVSLSALRTGRLYPRNYYWYSFQLEAENTVRPEGLCQ